MSENKAIMHGHKTKEIKTQSAEKMPTEPTKAKKKKKKIIEMTIRRNKKTGKVLKEGLLVGEKPDDYEEVMIWRTEKGDLTKEQMLADPSKVPYITVPPPKPREVAVRNPDDKRTQFLRHAMRKTPFWKNKPSGMIIEEKTKEPNPFESLGIGMLRLFYGRKRKVHKLEQNELILVPTEATRSRKPLEDEEYYHGFMRDAEVESIFEKHNFKVGSFLVRRAQSYTGLVYVLSVKRSSDSEKVFNMLINVTDEEKLFWLDRHAFKTIQQLVQFYVESEIPIDMGDHIVLKYPIKRFSWQIRPEQIQLDVLIGSGEFGEVYKGTLEVSFGLGRRPVAVKTLKGEQLTTQQIYDLIKEADNMKELRHRNVIKFYGIAAAREPFMIALEFCPGGALDERLEKTRTTDFQKIRFLYHAACGIEYLHQVGITHGDIAARNCLLSADDVVKIGDFGLSTETEGSKCREGKVPVRYMAPEAVEKMIVTKESDAWAFSALIFEVFHRAFGPYHEYDPLEKVKDFLRKDEVRMYLFERPRMERIPHELKVDVKKWSLTLDKPERPQIQAAMQILFTRLRFRNLKYRLTFQSEYNGTPNSNIVETLRQMMINYEIEE